VPRAGRGALRPVPGDSSVLGRDLTAGRGGIASNAWVVAHSLAIVAFVLLVLGLFGVYGALRQTSVERLTLMALVVSWVGVGLTLPFYGAEVFGLHAIGQAALRNHDASLVALASDVRGEPGIWFIVIGLVLLAAGIALFAIAIWRSRVLTRWIGIPLAAGFALYLPQFMTPQPVRVAHGFLITIGCGLVAWNLLASRP
jgi:hypothetical protein